MFNIINQPNLSVFHKNINYIYGIRKQYENQLTYNQITSIITNKKGGLHHAI